MNPLIFHVLQVFFWLSVFLLIYSYVLFPLLIRWLARSKSQNSTVFQEGDDWPTVSVLMSLYNEESIISAKLKTLIQQKYPKHSLHIYIGSDNSSDATNSLVQNYISEHSMAHFHFTPFGNRQGKPGVINQLYQEAIQQHGKGNGHILIITDASVMLAEDAIQQLVQHFKNDQIGLVDSYMQHTGLQHNGISKSEDLYISGEVQIKHSESIANGKMMGPFGGCYALRSDLFIPVPHNFLVDDFFLAMHVLNQGKNAINEPQAICYESVSHEISEEYRRKKRISTGNFQNLWTYQRLLLPNKGWIAFNFWSHKVLRWLGPFFIIIAFISNIFLTLDDNLFYFILLSFQAILIFIIPIFDLVLNRLSIHIRILRSIRYFFLMNLALLEGFINYLKGVQSNVWQPTKRPNSTE